jgi:hypothetical protein
LNLSILSPVLFFFVHPVTIPLPIPWY